MSVHVCINFLWFDQYFEEKVIDDREGGYSGNTEIPLKSHRMA